MSRVPWLKNLFTKEKPLGKGMYQYRTPPDAEERFRLHVFVDQPAALKTLERMKLVPDSRGPLELQGFGRLLHLPSQLPLELRGLRLQESPKVLDLQAIILQ